MQSQRGGAALTSSRGYSGQNFRTAGYEENANHENDTKIMNPELLHKIDALLARHQLSVCRPDLSLRQSAAEAAAGARGCEAHAVGTLGHDPRSEFYLRALGPDHICDILFSRT